NDEPRAMTAKDLAVYLQLHELTVRRLARDGELPITRIGRQWRTTRKILDEWFVRESMKNVRRAGE
ncbi:MAG: helix-turn-helix domain-containing protein, partial [Anaerolineae bacterium]|nr:helix-turn-helix domain-containing protein [Anaerolineae bacterium]